MKVLDGRLGNPPKDRPLRYAAELATMRRLIARGIQNLAEEKRPGSLKARYREEYAELAAEARGQAQLL